MADYNVWFVVGDSSVSLYFLIPQYGYFASLTFIIIIIIIINLLQLSFHSVAVVLTLVTIKNKYI